MKIKLGVEGRKADLTSGKQLSPPDSLSQKQERGRKAAFTRSALAFLALLAFNGSVPSRADAPPGLPRGKPAPAFRLFDINGKEYRLQDFRGKPTIINFWAFWCDTWKEELPQLEILAARRQDMDFRMLAISVDGTRLQEFRKKTRCKLPYPVLLDVGGQVSARYRINCVPTVVILDSAGRVQSFRVGCQSATVLLDTLRSLGRSHWSATTSSSFNVRGRIAPTSSKPALQIVNTCPGRSNLLFERRTPLTRQ